MVEQGKPIGKTEAGETVNKESLEQSKRHEAELVKIREEMAQALKEKDEEGRRELEEARATLQDQMKRLEKDREEMAAKYVAERARTEAWMREMVQKAKDRADAVATDPVYEWVLELPRSKIFLIGGFSASNNRKMTSRTESYRSPDEPPPEHGAPPPRDPRHSERNRNLYNPPPPREATDASEDLPPVMIACVPQNRVSC